MTKGIVIKSTGSWYEVRTETSEVIACRIKGKFRLDNQDLTNPVAVGDQVQIEIDEKDGTGNIKHIFPRKNYVVRQSASHKHHVQLMAANIDQAFLIVTMRHPKLKQGFIDRFLIMTEPYDIPVTILFNKSDLYQTPDWEYLEYLKIVYESIGYKVYAVSALREEGLAPIKEALYQKTTLFSGQSGVGKSSLINAIAPSLNIRVKSLSEYTGKGQHTTTFAEMYQIAENSYIIDSPGIKSLAFNHLEVMDISHNFREIFHFSKGCKFSNCTHRNEPKCTVKQAVENGEISELRYQSYLFLIDEVENQNYWERKSV